MKTNFGKGVLAFSEGKYEQAFIFFEKSFRENIPPDKHLTLYNMGLSLIFLEDLVPAEDCFLKALKYLPNHSDSLHWIAYINFRKGQLSTAQDHYLSSLKSHPRSHTSINGCIHFFIEQGLNGEEINSFLNKLITLEQCKELINIKTRQYAKRQNTWARGHMKNWNKLYSKNFSNLLKKTLKVVS